VNTDAPSLSLVEAKGRVLGIQTKLHRWATADASRRFDDLFVRREAPRDRAGVRDRRRGLVAAGPRSWGQPDPGDAEEGGKQS
jgi:RNA-directed DNA polymerase